MSKCETTCGAYVTSEKLDDGIVRVVTSCQTCKELPLDGMSNLSDTKLVGIQGQVSAFRVMAQPAVLYAYRRRSPASAIEPVLQAQTCRGGRTLCPDIFRQGLPTRAPKK